VEAFIAFLNVRSTLCIFFSSVSMLFCFCVDKQIHSKYIRIIVVPIYGTVFLQHSATLNVAEIWRKDSSCVQTSFEVTFLLLCFYCITFIPVASCRSQNAPNSFSRSPDPLRRLVFGVWFAPNLFFVPALLVDGVVMVGVDYILSDFKVSRVITLQSAGIT